MASKESVHGLDPALKKPMWQRIGWLIVIYIGSVTALGIVAYGMRLFMNAAGLTSH
ncbi:DUF2474 domain-containing protein [Pseudomonas sp. 10B1]|uniref:DUF2474 domain-containing protein n=1 Tax=unclassified Pseudomonas TaxID=196821 RepID=UPI002AB4289A|nr:MULTISPECIES: DUF2474 domain-containing protein [unclassified Pseudomonas]MDY7561956.1 DUF2474 domain-containing protein [Pseudomonas sp. AB6]MEA9993478.1 DUF2474 domain-containing protein [Pseudomonas sp. AA4]MEB0088587.1 DUF2474 domain-containing protein [Pseudomonas sp. RTI1]MEB0126249.1 DUF2474 domain-containing protein [Pseudomonas sp. CCC1.2]MEB0155052.1 DUF2474 domain-containing protein [Pseudomonas sp. CCC4.3]